MTPRERLIAALDVPSADAGRALAARLTGRAGLFKVGHQLFTAAGPAFVRELTGAGHGVFLDLKYHDIPNTVYGAVAAATQLGVRLANVHALGGRAMIAAAVRARRGSMTRLLAVTVLTSHDETSLREIGLERAVPDAVRHLARLAQDEGADGVVASPEEIALIRAECGPDFLIVTPGIRPSGSGAGVDSQREPPWGLRRAAPPSPNPQAGSGPLNRDDQTRVATPAAALAAGADYLVVGRPITDSEDPGAAADSVVAELETVHRGDGLD